MDIQYSADLRISKNRIMDIQKSIYGYQKIELWISKNRIMDIRKWGIKSKTAPHSKIHILKSYVYLLLAIVHNITIPGYKDITLHIFFLVLFGN